VPDKGMQLAVAHLYYKQLIEAVVSGILNV
jgi:hypothetical protein